MSVYNTKIPLLKILTIKEFCESKYKEKSSLFIAQAYPLSYPEETADLLNSVKKKFYDATHHCYAYRFNNSVKYSDDGEPSGTAGVRILNAIDHFSLNHILLIVIRYFGGVKLGVGPLGKAYYTSAVQALETCRMIEKIGHYQCKISVGFSFMSGVHKILNNVEAKLFSCEYENNADFTVMIKPDKIEDFQRELQNLTAGKFDFSCGKEIIFI